MLVMETLRRLECEFSVVRFGQGQVSLKKLDAPLTNEEGEKVLEGFSFDEGTDLRSGIDYALRNGFSRTVNRDFPDTVVHRCIMVMTDGFVATSEDARRSYQAVLKAATDRGERARICMLGIMDTHSEAIKDEILAGMDLITSGTVRRSKPRFLIGPAVFHADSCVTRA